MGCSNSNAVEPLRTMDDIGQEGDGRVKKRFSKQRGNDKDRSGRAKKEAGASQKNSKKREQQHEVVTEDFGRVVQQQLRAQHPPQLGQHFPEEPRPLLQLAQLAAEDNAASRGRQRREATEDNAAPGGHQHVEAAEDFAKGVPPQLRAVQLGPLLRMEPDPVIRLVQPAAEDNAAARGQRCRKVREDNAAAGGQQRGEAAEDAAAELQHKAKDTEAQHVVVTHHSAISMDGATRMGFPADYPDSDSDVASVHSRKAYNPHARVRDPDSDQEEASKDYRWRRVEWSRYIGLDYEEEAGERWVVDKAMQMILSNEEVESVLPGAMKAAIFIVPQQDPEPPSYASSASSDDSFGLGEAPYIKRRGKPRPSSCLDFLNARKEDREYSKRRAQAKRARAAVKEAKEAARRRPAP